MSADELDSMLQAAPDPADGGFLPGSPFANKKVELPVDQLDPSGKSSARMITGREIAREPWMWEPNKESENKLRALFIMIDRFEAAPGGGGISST